MIERCFSIFFSIENLCIQPSLTKDAFFTALSVAEINVNPVFERLCLGWKDTFPESGTVVLRLVDNVL